MTGFRTDLKVEMKRILGVGGLGLSLTCASTALAQDTGNSVIGPPQLRDYSLPPAETIVRQPAPAPAPAPEPVRVAPPSPAAQEPRAAPARQTTPAATRTQPAPVTTAPPSQVPPTPATPAPVVPPPVAETPSATAPAPAPAPAEEASPAPAPAAEAEGISYWPFAIMLVLLGLLAVALQRRRRSTDDEEPQAARESVAAPAPSQPRPDPALRPWIELELKTERAAFTDAEANVNFELEIRNSGQIAATNLRVDVKMFNGGAEQDKEIGTFFRTAGRQSTRLNLPAVAAGTSGVIRGEVGLKREDIKALRLDDRMLFIPVVAVNALYDFGERTGQSSKSYVIGRELQAASEKMGAFRVDQGPRIWRTVGQRQHKLARRV